MRTRSAVLCSPTISLREARFTGATAGERARLSAEIRAILERDLAQPQAYAYAVEVMAATSQTPDAAEGIAAFLEKRAVWSG